MMRIAFILQLVIYLSACSTTTGTHRIDYSEHHLYTGDSAGNYEFDEVGPVRHYKHSWGWRKCADIARAALGELNQKLEAKGADAVINVRFLDSKGRWTKEIVCNSDVIMSTTEISVTGTAIKYAH